MSLPARSITMWLVLLIVMFGNGVLRVAVLQPRLGEATARQVASLLGVALVFTLSGLFVGSLQAPSGAQLLQVGALWLGLTLVLETVMGRWVSHLSWGAVFADYNLLRGRLWPLVLLSTLVSPWLWGLLQRGGAE